MFKQHLGGLNAIVAAAEEMSKRVGLPQSELKRVISVNAVVQRAGCGR
jgi:hypothetical protein